jgi:hypothetical protein
MSMLDTNMIMEATKQAKNRPLEYSPAERASEIRQMLNDVPPLVNRGYTAEAIHGLFPEQQKKYPQLLKKIIEKQDLTPVRTMLNMLDNMAGGKITEHQASIVVGKQLVDKFVKPQLNGTS